MATTGGAQGDPGLASRPSPGPRSGLGARETLALIFLTVGSVLFSVLGWMVGIILLWTSTVWTTREKLVGTLVVPGGLAPAVVLGLTVGTYTCGSTSWTGPDGVAHTQTVCDGGGWSRWLSLTVLVVLVLGPIITSIWLGWVGARKSRATG